MHARTLAALTVTVAAAAGCPAPRGDAAHPRPAPGTAPTMDEAAVMRRDSFCPYVSADGPSVVCIDISSMGRIGAVILDVGARSRREIPLVDVEGFDPCGGSEGVRTVLDDGFAALNRELASRIYRPAEVLLAYDPDPNDEGGDPPPPPPPHVAGAGTLSMAAGDERVLTLTSGGEVVETLRTHWYPVTVVALGDRHVGVVSHHRIQVWDLAARPPSCAASPRCPSHYPLARSYLGAICDDAFGDQNEDYPWRIADDQASGALAADDFAILAAAYGALTGEPFQDQGLRDFFHGADASAWLPAACFGRFATMRTLPEDRRWERDRVSRGARGLPLDGEE